MKRTRRIEVIRYSRRVTEFTNDDQLDRNAEQGAIDALLLIPEAMPIGARETASAGNQGPNSDDTCTTRNDRLPKLFDWLKTKLSRAPGKQKGNAK